MKINAQLCSLLWNSLDKKLLPLFRTCKTCYKVWNKAKSLYTNDIQRIYKVVSDLAHLHQDSLDMVSYLGKVEVSKDEFDSLMPITNNVDEMLKQRDRLFMVFTLTGLQPELSAVKDQILASPTIPSLDEVVARLMRISGGNEVIQSESSLLAVQKNHQLGDHRKWRGKSSKHCTHCNKDGHTRNTCWALHGRPPTLINPLHM